MKKKILFLPLLLAVAFSFCANDLAPSFGEIKAYPNPFKPDGTAVLKVVPIGKNFEDKHEVIMQVLDYNQVEVFKKTFSGKTGTPPKVEWSGYSESKRVPNGVYTIFLHIAEGAESYSAETRIIVE